MIGLGLGLVAKAKFFGLGLSALLIGLGISLATQGLGFVPCYLVNITTCVVGW